MQVLQSTSAYVRLQELQVIVSAVEFDDQALSGLSACRRSGSYILAHAYRRTDGRLLLYMPPKRTNQSLGMDWIDVGRLDHASQKQTCVYGRDFVLSPDGRTSYSQRSRRTKRDAIMLARNLKNRVKVYMV